jgi:uncharacterized membrane protein
MPQTSTPALTEDVAGLAALFLASGATHLLRPQTFYGMIPRSLRSRRREVVLASGVAELLCAAGLLHPSTRRASGLASAVLLVAVLPGNTTMTARAARRARATSDTSAKAYLGATVARLPLQWPMIRTALRAAGRLR